MTSLGQPKNCVCKYGACIMCSCLVCSFIGKSTMLMNSTPSLASSATPPPPTPLFRLKTNLSSAFITTTSATLSTSLKPNGYIQRSRRWTPLTMIRVLSDNRTAGDESLSVSIESGSDVVRNFYGGINGRDLASVEDLIAENCVYEDLIFPQPFVGRKAILEFFKKFIDSISTDLQFVIDDISGEDSSAVGVTWHLEWKGKPFPFSKGCSFYRLEVVNGKRQIIYGRDSVEPSIKPGETALVAIRGVTWLLQQFPQLADRL